MEFYAKVRSGLEGRPFRLGEDQGVMRSTYVASSMDEAGRESEAAIMSSFMYNNPFSGLPLGKTLQNLENFATKVMPRFSGAG